MEIETNSQFHHDQFTSPSLEVTLSMNGGDGDASYVANSQVQGRVIQAMRPMVEDLVEGIFDDVMKKNPMVLRVADTGCATGSNTMFAMDVVVKTIEERCLYHGIEIPEIQVFFSDLAFNDFNTLLRNLPPQVFKDEESLCESGEFPTNRSYFAAAVVGSHHGRLFPRSYLHFCHSSISVHILSRVPPEVKDKSSEAWNGKHVYISNDKVAEAYLRQFTQDFTSFLHARAQEIVEGGGLFIIFPSRKTPEPGIQGCVVDSARRAESAIKLMIDDGVVDETVLENLNFPTYAPNGEEVEKIVAEEATFEIKRMELKTGLPGQTMTVVKKGEEIEFGESEEMRYRSGFESILVGQLGWGSELLKEFFGRIRSMASSDPEKYLKDKVDMLAVSLVRKAQPVSGPQPYEPTA